MKRVNQSGLKEADFDKLLSIEYGADVTADQPPKAHKSSHENGGADEISVADLSGLLADDQHVLDAEVSSVISADVDKAFVNALSIDGSSINNDSGWTNDDAADAAQDTADAAIPKSVLTEANTMVLGSAAETPGTLTIAASRIVGRAAAGNVTGLTAAETRTLIDVDPRGTDNSTDVTLNAKITDVFSLTDQEISAVDKGSDAVIGWDESANKMTFLSDADVRTAIDVDVSGTDNSTDVTLNASATTGGMSISEQEISNRAATNAQTGYATAAHIAAIETNTAKTGVTDEISNVVEDTTPQLGGDLDVNGHDMTSATGLDIAIGSSAGNDFTVDTNKLVVEGDTGNVGIGTTSPAKKIEIYDTSPIIRLSGTGNNLDNNPYGAIEFYNRDTSGDGPQVGAKIEVQSGYSLGLGGEIVFSTAYGTGVGEGSDPIERMRIDRNGDVFLLNDLNIDGDAAFDGVCVFTTSNGFRTDTVDGSDNKYLKFAGGGNYSETRGAVFVLSGNEEATYGGDVVINPGGNAGAQIQMDGTLYVGDGKVGIGEDDPSTILDVVAGSSTDPVADAWDTHCGREDQEIIEKDEDSKLEKLKTIPTYRWKKIAKVSDKEAKNKVDKKTKKVKEEKAKLNGKLKQNFEEIDGEFFEILEPTQQEILAKKEELIIEKRGLPKFTTERVGIMMDDDEVPSEILTFDADGNKTGISLVGWIGYLTEALKEAGQKIDELENRIKKLEEK